MSKNTGLAPLGSGAPLRLELLLGEECDAGQTLAVSRELTSISQEIFERPAPPLNSALVIPRDFSRGNWATSTAYRTSDSRGEMTPVAGLATDFPEVLTGIDETVNPVREYGSSYGFGRKELVYAAKLGMALDRTKVMAAMRAYEELVDKMALDGDEKRGVKGLKSYKDIKRKVATKALASMSVDEQLEYLHGLFELVNHETSDTETANTLVLPKKLRDKLAHKRVGTDSGNESVLTIFLRENSYCEQVVTWQRLYGAGDTRKGVEHDLVGAWRPDPMVLRQQIPEPFTILEPQMTGTRTIHNCVASIGAVEVIRPGAIALGEIPRT
jgi:hypothetical protein